MSFTLAHLSDPHLSPMPGLAPLDFFSKRLLGYLNWRRKRHRIHNPAILARLVQDMHMQRPDHVAALGDFTNLGLAQEYMATRDWLRALAPAENVSIVPGNHDAYVDGALEAGLPYVREWIKGPFPYLQTYDEITLIHVSSAIPTPPFMATGQIGGVQLAKLAKRLEEAKEKFRIVLLHHALDCFAWHKRLFDAEELKEVLHKKGAELVLHGHLHRFDHYQIGPTHVFGVPSASADPACAKHPAGYALYRIEKDEDGWHVDIERRSIDARLMISETERMQLRF